MTDKKSWEADLVERYGATGAEPPDFIESAVNAVQQANAGSTAEAVTSGRRAVSISPTDPRGHAALAYALWVGGDNEGAVEAADQSLELSEGDQLAQVVRSAALTNLGLYDVAADSSLAALKQWPDDPVLLRVAAAANVQAKRYGPALDAASRLVNAKPNDGQPHLILGLALGGLYRLKEAEVAYRTGLARFPSDPELLNGLGFTLVLLGKSAEAEAYLRRSVEAKETWYAYGSLAACLIGLADMFKDDDLYSEVISTIDSALVLIAADKPDADEHGRLFLQRGYAHGRLRNFGSAKRDFRSAIERARPQSTVSLMAGRNLRRINEAVARSPDPPRWLPHALAAAVGLAAIYAGAALFFGHIDQNVFFEVVFASLVVIIAAYSLPSLTKIKLGTVELEKQVAMVPDVALEVRHIG